MVKNIENTFIFKAFKCFKNIYFLLYGLHFWSYKVKSGLKGLMQNLPHLKAALKG